VLPGRPTAVQSPVRQAAALGIRLGWPLQQIITCLITHSFTNRGHFSGSLKQPGLYVYTLCKVHKVCLARAVHASSSCAVSGVRSRMEAESLAGLLLLLGLLHCLQE
jgi:hypothetical protein